MSFCKLQYLLGWKAHQTEQQSLKVHFGGLEFNITRTCTLGNEMQLQLCAKDEATQQAKPTWDTPAQDFQQQMRQQHVSQGLASLVHSIPCYVPHCPG